MEKMWTESPMGSCMLALSVKSKVPLSRLFRILRPRPRRWGYRLFTRQGIRGRNYRRLGRGSRTGYRSSRRVGEGDG